MLAPLQAIQAATVGAAEALGRRIDVGAIAVRRYDEMIAVKCDPLKEVTLLRNIPFVTKSGKWRGKSRQIPYNNHIIGL